MAVRVAVKSVIYLAHDRVSLELAPEEKAKYRTAIVDAVVGGFLVDAPTIPIEGPMAPAEDTTTGRK
jgi:hypothetical protein